MRLSRLMTALLIVVFLAQTAYYYPFLPATAATHFNAAGIADGWMPKEAFIVFEVILLFFIVAEFTLVPAAVEKMPDALLNIPNKDFWLAETRRAATFETLRIYFEWFAAGLLVLFIVINNYLFRANLNNENLPGAQMWLIIGLFVLFTVVWLASLMRKFRKTF